jgi:hypothetical protein
MYEINFKSNYQSENDEIDHSDFAREDKPVSTLDAVRLQCSRTETN